MIDFRLLRHFWYFLAVAEERHFGKAAKRLGMSQPPLSQQIQVLEKSLGVKLFERSRQGVRLTKQGSEILGPVQRFMEHAQRLQLAVLDARDGRNTTITIGAVNAALYDIMPKVTRIAGKRYPQLSMSVSEMDSASALAAVQNGEIDIALGALRPEHPPAGNSAHSQRAVGCRAAGRSSADQAGPDIACRYRRRKSGDVATQVKPDFLRSRRQRFPRDWAFRLALHMTCGPSFRRSRWSDVKMQSEWCRADPCASGAIMSSSGLSSKRSRS